MQVTCNKCKWVHYQVSRQHAESEVKRFNEYFDTLDDEAKSAYGGKKATLALYDRCGFCNGGYQNFRDFEPGDCPNGCTLSPIIDRNE